MERTKKEEKRGGEKETRYALIPFAPSSSISIARRPPPPSPPPSTPRSRVCHVRSRARVSRSPGAKRARSFRRRASRHVCRTNPLIIRRRDPLRIKTNGTYKRAGA